MILTLLVFNIALAAFFLYNVKKEESNLIRYIQASGWYPNFHLLIGFYCLFLGKFGKQIVNKSAGNVLNSFGKQIGPIAISYQSRLFESLKSDWTSKVPTILEIGPGSGVNFDYYPEKCQLHLCEPEPSFQQSLKSRIKQRPGFKLLGMHSSGAENLDKIPDHSVDVVIGTFVLCSVFDSKKVLKELKRVLKPGGKYYFSEHDADHSNLFRGLMHKFLMATGIWPYLMLNCSFRDTLKCLKTEGFSIEKHFDLSFPAELTFVFWLCRPMYHGVATVGTQ